MFKALNPARVLHDLSNMSAWGRFFAPVASIIIWFVCVGNNVPWWEMIASISGVLCVLMVADRRNTNYFWGLINCSLYGMIAYNNGIFGDAALNWGIYIPFQFIGMYMWSRSDATDAEGDVIAKRLTLPQLTMCVFTTFAMIGLFSILLSNGGGAQPMLDATTTTLALVATFLMAYKFREQWICWILVNLTSIVMWAKTYMAGDGEGVAALAMWVAFFANSCYGYYNWSKQQKGL